MTARPHALQAYNIIGEDGKQVFKLQCLIECAVVPLLINTQKSIKFFPSGREQGDRPGDVEAQLPRPSHLGCLVQKVGGADREDLQQITATEICLGHRYGRRGLCFLTVPPSSPALRQWLF